MTNSKVQPQATNQLSPEEFLKYFPSAFIQYFDDSEKKDKTKSKSTACFNAEEAARKQRSRCGVYFSPNAFQGKRQTDCLKAIQAVFADIDCAKEGDGKTSEEITSRKSIVLQKLQNFSMKPHVVIETKNGLQAIWMTQPVNGSKNQLLFRETEELLIAYFDADKGVKDPTRVLRLPGFLHQKDPKNPFMCILKLNELQREKYTLQEIFDELKALEPQKKTNGKGVSPKGIAEEVAKGGRNTAAASMTGRILMQLDEEQHETKGWEMLCEWNERKSNPPLSENELRRVFKSILRKYARDDGKKTDKRGQAAILIALAQENGDRFFHDQHSRPHVAVKKGRSHGIFGVESQAYRRVLAKVLWEKTGKAANKNALESAVAVLAAMAENDYEQIKLHNRVARVKEALWYDLSDEGGRAVKITKTGYEVVDDPPILFRRYSHQQAQVLPCAPKDADTFAFLEFVNLRDPLQKHLLLTWIATCFLPDIPHPLLNFYGPQGSAKSMCASMLKQLIDPSTLTTISLSVNNTELIQSLDHHWFIVFDNLQRLPVWTSDELCRAITGGGFSKRELYKNDDDFIYSFRRCICLNGINLVSTRPDLLDRSILFRFERIGGRERITEIDIWPKFEKARPRILGGIFKALSKAMSMKAIHLDELPRMADFAKEGCLLAEALGIPHKDFLAAYKANRAIQHEEAIHEDPVGVVVLEYMKKEQILEGTPSDIYTTLTKIADDIEMNTYANCWPNSPQSFTRRLNELATNLTEIGLRINTHGKKDGQRWTIIEWQDSE